MYSFIWPTAEEKEEKKIQFCYFVKMLYMYSAVLFYSTIIIYCCSARDSDWNISCMLLYVVTFDAIFGLLYDSCMFTMTCSLANQHLLIPLNSTRSIVLLSVITSLVSSLVFLSYLIFSNSSLLPHFIVFVLSSPCTIWYKEVWGQHEKFSCIPNDNQVTLK